GSSGRTRTTRPVASRSSTAFASRAAGERSARLRLVARGATPRLGDDGRAFRKRVWNLGVGVDVVAPLRRRRTTALDEVPQRSRSGVRRAAALSDASRRTASG